MEFIRIKDWDKLQHYKDRNPPWIKLHTCLLFDYKFTRLQDDSKLLLMLLWMLASRLSNEIPCDLSWIRNQLNIKKVELQPLIESDFIEVYQNDSITIATCKQDAPQRQRQRQRRVETDNGDLFEQFWQVYPKKVGKGKAKESFHKIKPSKELFDQIISAVEIQKKSEQWRKENGQYIPNPSTWLNQERWGDELPHKETTAEQFEKLRKAGEL